LLFHQIIKGDIPFETIEAISEQNVQIFHIKNVIHELSNEKKLSVIKSQ
jgi:hypothetical protein